ncbi:pentapeptide repeat-containing protein [Saccharomonospora azurea]|uniref:pentapeptide repeat-containing protein n=1 Tax=Saccharomonospora azurea TaxID=40988 RepID=UPI003D93B5BF
MRPLPAASIWWIFGLLLIVAIGATVWLLSSFGDGSEQDKVQLETIRLAGTIVLGTGGAAALFVALRRQRATELDLVQKQRAHELQQQVAEQSRLDAEQRRVTELYTAAAEQLGHERAAVRLAGLYALQRLGQVHPEQRRPIVNVWCAYLRMPFRDPDAEDVDEQERAERLQEAEVRLTVQRLLREHVHSSPEHDELVSSRYWGDDLDVDLAGAILYRFDLRGCRIHPHAAFTDATFIGAAWFNDATFTGTARFAKATFTETAWFDSATFTDTAWFDSATFTDTAWFDDATFTDIAKFNNATFTDTARFDDATFTDAWFNNATFAGSIARFDNARFAGVARFESVKFISTAWFDKVKFADSVRFDNARFTENARFDNATFAGAARFTDIAFTNARFNGTATFTGAVALLRDDHAWPSAWVLQPDKEVAVPKGGNPAGMGGKLVWAS